MERYSFRIFLGDSPETIRKLRLSTKFPHLEISWNYDILCSEPFLKNLTWFWTYASKRTLAQTGKEGQLLHLITAYYTFRFQPYVQCKVILRHTAYLILKLWTEKLPDFSILCKQLYLQITLRVFLLFSKPIHFVNILN